jgi:hypothetical protein
MIMGKENVLSRSIEDHKQEGSPILFHLDKTPYEFEELPMFRSLIHSEVVTNEKLVPIHRKFTRFSIGRTILSS